MYEFVYTFGGLMLIASFWFILRTTLIHFGSAPARGKGLPPEAQRYFNELNRILEPHKHDKTVRECLFRGNKWLSSEFNRYRPGFDNGAPYHMFGADSFDKNREEAWACCYLASYNDSEIIKAMREKLLTRLTELMKQSDACPPEIYENFWAAKEHVWKIEREQKETEYRETLIEHIARSPYRKYFPNFTMSEMLELFMHHRYDVGIFATGDITQSTVNKAIKYIAETKTDAE